MRSTHHPHYPHHSLFLSILSTSPEQPGMGLQDPRLPHHRKPPTTCPSPPPNPPKHPATKTGVRACTILHGQDSATSLLRFLMLSDSCRGKLVALSIQYTTQQSVLETLMNKPLARVRSTRTRAPPFVHAQHRALSERAKLHYMRQPPSLATPHYNTLDRVRDRSLY